MAQAPNKHIIVIDDELYEYLKTAAVGFESRNTVLRRLLGFPPSSAPKPGRPKNSTSARKVK